MLKLYSCLLVFSALMCNGSSTPPNSEASVPAPDEPHILRRSQSYEDLRAEFVAYILQTTEDADTPQQSPATT